ncbi:hypothetical protein NE237_000515 [Protea cynaroides]|uniref:Uncharacterized protein n=1 Tax=Protea cynaroides TaxID=273540 RepID=A0A9Q0KRQ5_9MAGN|nr:hypothetical protein NE237_000515 [Protea cynaroides]
MQIGPLCSKKGWPMRKLYEPLIPITAEEGGSSPPPELLPRVDQDVGGGKNKEISLRDPVEEPLLRLLALGEVAAAQSCAAVVGREAGSKGREKKSTSISNSLPISGSENRGKSLSPVQDISIQVFARGGITDSSHIAILSIPGAEHDGDTDAEKDLRLKTGPKTNYFNPGTL